MSNRRITVDELGTSLRKVKTETANAISAHNADEASHPFILGKINDLADRVFALEIANGGDITANPFTVTFDTLDGLVVSGVHNTVRGTVDF